VKIISMMSGRERQKLVDNMAIYRKATLSTDLTPFEHGIDERADHASLLMTEEANAVMKRHGM
jgi:hypothetical protein